MNTKLKKALYESIMNSVAKIVKRSLNEEFDAEELEELTSIEHPIHGTCEINSVFDTDKGDYYEVYDEDGEFLCELPYGSINMTDEDELIAAIDDAISTDAILYDQGIDPYADPYEDDEDF